MANCEIKKVPDEYVDYDWEAEVDAESLRGAIVIHDSMGWLVFGDKAQADIITGDYYDDDLGYDYEAEEELKKAFGGEWEERTFHGYSQGDWASCYYDSEKVSEERLKEIEDYLIGKVDEFSVREDGDDSTYAVYVPHDVSWKGKAAICEFIGVDPDEAKVFVDDGYVKTYKYKELD